MFTVIVNQPGYLPEHPADVAEWDTIEAARTGLLVEISTTAEAGDYGYAEVDAAQAAAEDATVDQAVMLGGWAHTIVAQPVVRAIHGAKADFPVLSEWQVPDGRWIVLFVGPEGNTLSVYLSDSEHETRCFNA